MNNAKNTNEMSKQNSQTAESQTVMNEIKTFENWNGDSISFAPFFHNACNVYRVARNVNQMLDSICEAKAFRTKKACQLACDAEFNQWNKQAQ
jgi:hypothetical protein